MSSDKRTQAERVIAKFGGPKGLYHALAAAGEARDLVSIYRWRYPKSKGGTGGHIPSGALDGVHAAARLEGIYLTAEDVDPRPL